jgi:hypothetical protein
MKEILFIFPLLTVINFSHSQGTLTCGQDMKQVSSVKQCLTQTILDTKNANNTNYCCMLTVTVGSSSRSVCVPVNNTNYEKLNKSSSLSPYTIINNKYEYNLYCREDTSSSKDYWFNYFLYILIIICLI